MPLNSRNGAFDDDARHVAGCQLTVKTRVQYAFDDLVLATL